MRPGSCQIDIALTEKTRQVCRFSDGDDLMTTWYNLFATSPRIDVGFAQ